MSDTTTLLDALLAVQSEVPTLPKDATNPHFRSKYTPLDTIVETVGPVLNKHKLVWTTLPGSDSEGDPVLAYRLLHAPTGEALEGIMPLLLPQQNAQGMGSAITYARRYSLCAVLNLVADDDDDGNAAVAGGGSTRRAAGAPSQKQMTYFKRLVTTAQNNGMKAPTLRIMLDNVGASDVAIEEGWKEKLTSAQVSALIDVFKEGTLPTGESDVPGEAPRPAQERHGDDLPWEPEAKAA